MFSISAMMFNNHDTRYFVMKYVLSSGRELETYL